jgi:hypothetical protein
MDSTAGNIRGAATSQDDTHPLKQPQSTNNPSASWLFSEHMTGTPNEEDSALHQSAYQVPIFRHARHAEYRAIRMAHEFPTYFPLPPVRQPPPAAVGGKIKRLRQVRNSKIKVAYDFPGSRDIQASGGGTKRFLFLVIELVPEVVLAVCSIFV